MTQFSKTISALAVFVFVFSLFAFLPRARGAECNLRPAAEKLESIQNAPLPDYPENLKQELAARQELLGAVIDCVALEVDALQQTAAEIPATGDIPGIKNDLQARIQEAKEFLERLRLKIPDLGIQGSKNMAREIKTWRDSSYERLQKETENLKIWSSNQTLFETAAKRWEQINQTLRRLKLLENENIQKLYQKSGESLKAATNLHRQALSDIKNYRPPEEVQEKIRLSLETLSQTYENFLELSREVKKILPL